MNAALLQESAVAIEELSASTKRPVIGVSGPDAGSNLLACHELKEHLQRKGRNVGLVSLDDYRNPEAVWRSPTNQAKRFYEGGFDFDRLFDDGVAAAQRNDSLDAVLVSGVFLFRTGLKPRFPLRIWVDCTIQTAMERMIESEEFKEIWRLALIQHFSIDEPKSRADFVLRNDPVLDRGPRVLLPSLALDGQLRPGLRWLNEPACWRLEGDRLRLAPDARSDFWQRTHYGFENDNGHFLFTETSDDFLMQAEVWWEPRHQFDQAGLMVRVDPDNWMKTAIEHQPGNPSSLGAVVTNLGYSDWSIQPVTPEPSHYRMRVERHGCDVAADVSFSGGDWFRIRVARLQSGRGAIQAGVYACSPMEGGFEAVFESLTIKEVLR